jgi:hypothetical protein
MRYAARLIARRCNYLPLHSAPTCLGDESKLNRYQSRPKNLHCIWGPNLNMPQTPEAMDQGSSLSQASEPATVIGPGESECDSDEYAFYTDEGCPSSVEQGPSWIRRPILPVDPEDVWRLSKYDTPDMPVHRLLPAPFVQELFSLAPILSSPIPLSAGYNEVNICLMAIDPATGDSLSTPLSRRATYLGWEPCSLNACAGPCTSSEN